MSALGGPPLSDPITLPRLFEQAARTQISGVARSGVQVCCPVVAPEALQQSRVDPPLARVADVDTKNVLHRFDVGRRQTGASYRRDQEHRPPRDTVVGRMHSDPQLAPQLVGRVMAHDPPVLAGRAVKSVVGCAQNEGGDPRPCGRFEVLTPQPPEQTLLRVARPKSGRIGLEVVESSVDGGRIVGAEAVFDGRDRTIGVEAANALVAPIGR